MQNFRRSRARHPSSTYALHGDAAIRPKKCMALHVALRFRFAVGVPSLPLLCLCASAWLMVVFGF